MQRPTLGVRAYRRLAQLSLLLAMAVTVAGLWFGLQGHWPLLIVGLVLGALLLLPPQWATIRAEAGSENALVFVTKPECSLCDEARALLPQIIQGTPFVVKETSVVDDRFVRRHFKNAVPVLLWQGEELARLSWDPGAIRLRLDEILSQRSSPTGPENP